MQVPADLFWRFEVYERMLRNTVDASQHALHFLALTSSQIERYIFFFTVTATSKTYANKAFNEMLTQEKY